MPEVKEKKPEMVPLSDLMRQKTKAEKLEKELAELQKRYSEVEMENRQLQSQSKTLKANLEDDDEVKAVREYLLKEDERLAKLSKGHEERESAIAKRERVARAKELVLDYKSKGLELDEQALLDAENPESFAKDKHLEFLATENEKLKKEPSNPAETVFESGDGKVVKKSVGDMSDAEFEAHWNKQYEGALAKK